MYGVCRLCHGVYKYIIDISLAATEGRVPFYLLLGFHHLELLLYFLFIPSEAKFYSFEILVVVVVVVVHGHFWISGSGGSILQRFGFKLLVRASRVAKIL